MTKDFNARARRLRNAVEPVAAGIYFAPEAHTAYEALGFDGSPASADGVARPELKSYFTSRNTCMGQLAGEVVAAAFGCFNPKVVVPAVSAGWQITSRAAILTAAREQATTAMLQRILGHRPEGLARVTVLLQRAAASAPWAGRAVYGGLRSLGVPNYPVAAMWRAADLVREHRGDSHVISWAVGGADAVEVLLLTEQWWGLPARSYTPSRGWQEADMDAGFERLGRRGLMHGEKLTDAGRAFREEIEVRTDELERPLLDALGDDLDELLGYLDVWSDAVIAGGSYPQRIAGVYNVGGGPHFGAGLTIDTAAEQYAPKA